MPTGIWRQTSDPPDVPRYGTLSVIVARQGKVFTAWYLNQCELGDDAADDPDIPPLEIHTGFYVRHRDREWVVWYEPIDVDFWTPMPEPPKTAKRQNNK